MTAQFQIVSDILTRVRRQADIEGQTDRHSDAALLTQFNASAGELRVRLSNLGFDWFLERTSGTLPTTAADTGETYAEIDWPIDAMRIYRVDVLFQTGLWLSLKPATTGGLRDFQLWHQFWDTYGIPADGPALFALRKAPFGAAAVETVGKIMVAPVPRTARTYALFYLKNWSDLESTDTFNGHASFIEWIVQDMVVKISERDNDSNMTFAIAAAERDRLEKLFASEAPKTQLVGADVPRRAGWNTVDSDWGPRMVP